MMKLHLILWINLLEVRLMNFTFDDPNPEENEALQRRIDLFCLKHPEYKREIYGLRKNKTYKSEKNYEEEGF